MKKIVWRITFQTVWLNVKTNHQDHEKKGRRKTRAHGLSSNLDTKVYENKQNKSIKSRQTKTVLLRFRTG